MEIDKNLLNKLRSLDDDTLRKAIDAIAVASGADAKQRAKAQDSVKAIRRKLDRASEKDLKKVAEKLEPGKAEEIIRQLKI